MNFLINLEISQRLLNLRVSIDMMLLRFISRRFKFHDWRWWLLGHRNVAGRQLAVTVQFIPHATLAMFNFTLDSFTYSSSDDENEGTLHSYTLDVEAGVLGIAWRVIVSAKNKPQWMIDADAEEERMINLAALQHKEEEQ